MSDFSAVDINEVEVDGVVSLQPTGRLDTRTGAGLEARVGELLTAGKAQILIDCRALEYVNSGGLRVLMGVAGAVSDAGGHFAVYGASEHVRDVLDLAGLSSLFPVCASRTEALAAVV